jgi:hypothetical protein
MRLIRWFLGCLWLWVGGAVQAVSLVQGPVVALTPTNAVIRWTTDVAAGSRVQFGVSPGRMDRREQSEVGTEHEVRLTGLKPGTTYHYSVGTARVPLATNSFTTPLRDGEVAVPRTNVVASPTATAASPTTQPRPPPTRVTWGSVRTLQDHFDRHGADFAATDPDDYAAQAWLFLVRAKTDGLSAKVDSEGVVRVFDAQTGAFAAYNPDGTTKTYFKPGRRGYFADQPGKSVDLRKFSELPLPR